MQILVAVAVVSYGLRTVTQFLYGYYHIIFDFYARIILFNTFSPVFDLFSIMFLYTVHFYNFNQVNDVDITIEIDVGLRSESDRTEIIIDSVDSSTILITEEKTLSGVSTGKSSVRNFLDLFTDELFQ